MPHAPLRRSRGEMTAGTTAKLVAAARTAFRTEGYAAASMDALCAEAGVTRGALYHHFGGKEGLLEAVVRQIDAEIGARLDAEEARHADPWEAFRACCHLWLRQALDPEIQRIYLRDATAVLGQRMREMDEVSSIAPIRDALGRLMEAGRVRPTDPEALARLINGGLVDAALWVAGSPRPDEALARAHAATDALLAGLTQGNDA
jgi:AcrR family transcriptional regulator